jgi:MFS family permease
MLHAVLGLGARMSQQFGALGGVFESPPMRRLQLAWAGYYTGEWAQLVALSVYAYHAGGATAVGILGLVRMIPAAAVLPFGALLSDRYRRERVLFFIHLARAATIGTAALAVAAHGSTAVIFVLAALPPFSAAPFRPAHWALLPALARTPQELVAANVSGSTLEGAATLVGPLLAGVLLSVTGPSVVLGVSSAIYLWCAFLVARIGHQSGAPAVIIRSVGALNEALGGVRAIARDSSTRVLVGLFTAQALVRGLLNVLIVAAALGLLHLGQPGVGFLNSALGAGGLLGALGAVALVGRRRLAGFFGWGLVFWGVPIALIAGWPAAAFALVCLALVGAGNSVLDVSGLTLLQRAVDDSVLGRVFGALEMLNLLSVGIGSILAPLLIAELGIRGTLVATGLLLPLLAIGFWPRLRAIDRSAVVPERELELLAALPLFSPLPVTTLEKLASRLESQRVSPGADVVTQGNSGERFYVIAEGDVDVTHDGRHVQTLGPGGYFGEIALLHDVPRTATVTARTELLLYSLEREAFLAAVTGHPEAAAAADAAARARLEATAS